MRKPEGVSLRQNMRISSLCASRIGAVRGAEVKRAVPLRAQAALFLTAAILITAVSRDAAACRYSVREVGFVDLDRGTYHLYIYHDDTVSDDTMNALRHATALRLRESCIETEFVDVATVKEHPALAFREGVSDAPLPSAVLLSPDERAREVPLAGPDGDMESAIEALVDSPVRRQVLETIVEAYCVVLFLEGADEEANAKARAAAAASVDAMTRNMRGVEKPTDVPPVLAELARDAQPQEAWLLWSLGLEPGPQTEPGVAVLFGRGRRLGPTLLGDRIITGELTRVMGFIGASCECGLDRTWMQGTMTPLRWDRPVRERLARHLGFDPDSPLVRMEINQILAQGPAEGTGLRFDDPFFGYREFSTAATEEPDGTELPAAAAESTTALEHAEEGPTLSPALPVQETGRYLEGHTETVTRPQPGQGLPVFVWVAGTVVLVNLLVVLGLVVRSRWNAP